MTKSLCGHHIGKRTIEELGLSLQVFTKTVSDGTCVMFCGIVFHIREAITGKSHCQWLSDGCNQQQEMMMKRLFFIT